MIQYRFPGKVVLVTGSSRGMGATILEYFARAGATCIINFFNDHERKNLADAEETALALRKYNLPVHILEADVRNFESVQHLMNKVVATAGGLDILVNNAGICRDKSVKKMTLDEWSSV